MGHFAQRVRRRSAWAGNVLPASDMKTYPVAVCDKRDELSQSAEHEQAQHTRHRVDRWLQFLDRACLHAQSFHGLPASAATRVRALALLWHFCPSCSETVQKHGGQAWPAERLHGKRYAENGLENLLVAGSMNGVAQDPQNPL